MRLTLRRKGSSLVEAVVAIAVILIIVAGIVSVYPIIFRQSLETLNEVKAGLLLEEGLESVRSLNCPVAVVVPDSREKITSLTPPFNP